MIAVPILVGDDGRAIARRLSAVVVGLVALAEVDLSEHPRPPLYELARAGRVRYRRERAPRERWLCPSLVLAGGGDLDCEDAAAWRAAELRLAGERALAYVRTTARGNLFHAVVRREDGRVEDPSRRIISLERRRQHERG